LRTPRFFLLGNEISIVACTRFKKFKRKNQSRVANQIYVCEKKKRLFKASGVGACFTWFSVFCFAGSLALTPDHFFKMKKLQNLSGVGLAPCRTNQLEVK